MSGSERAAPPTPTPANPRFTRLSLAATRPLYWASGVGAAEHANALGRLATACLWMPGVRLGVWREGVLSLLEGAKEREAGDWETGRADGWRERFRAWVDDDTSDGAWIWLTSTDAVWWIQDLGRSLTAYAKIARGRDNEGQLYDLQYQFRTTVFGALDTEAMDCLVEMANNGNALHGPPPVLFRPTDEEATSPPVSKGLYWSWRVADFSINERLSYTPALVLWSWRPCNTDWAPPAGSCGAGASLTSEEVVDLLGGRMRDTEETFSRLRTQRGLSDTRAALGYVLPLTPLFFLADLMERPQRGEMLVEGGSAPIDEVVKRCLGCDDATAEGVAWGVVEGDLVALRREQLKQLDGDQESCRPCYLVLPVKSKDISVSELEKDWAHFAENAGFLEDTIVEEVERIIELLGDVVHRIAFLGRVQNELDKVLSIGQSCLRTCSNRTGLTIFKELERVRGSLRVIVNLVDRCARDLREAQELFDSYRDSTRAYFRQEITYRRIREDGVFELKTALIDANPYRSVLPYFREYANEMADIAARLDKSRALLANLVGAHEQEVRQKSDDRFKKLGAAFTILALIIALPQYMEPAGLDREAFNYFDTYSLVVGGEIVYNTFKYSVRALVGLGIVLAILFLIVDRIQAWRQGRQEAIARHSITSAQALWDTVVQTESLMRESGTDIGHEEKEKLNEIDAEATSRMIEWLQEAEVFTRRPSPRQRRFTGRQVPVSPTEHWLSRSQWFRGLIDYVAACPGSVPLPRTLLVARCSTNVWVLPVESREAFSASLVAVGFPEDVVERLYQWSGSGEVRREWSSSGANEQGEPKQRLAEFLTESGVRAFPSDESKAKMTAMLDRHDRALAGPRS